jgi:cytochrome P450
LIRERRKTGENPGDLLSMLLGARDESGQGMDDQQLRDELVTLMVAGLDTTALAVSWSLYLLAKNPLELMPLRQEIRNIIGDRPPAFSDLPQLRATDAVLKESMRLYPPGWIIGREAIADCEVGGRRIRKGSSIIVSQWLKHRDERHFPAAQAFRPARWLDGSQATLPKFAYFPFGGGPRICIGNTFAMMEGTLVLATIFQKFRVSCPPKYEVKPWPSITLQPQGGIKLQLADL